MTNQWQGAGWKVSIDADAQGEQTVVVDQQHGSSPAEARKLAASVRQAATQIDGNPPSGTGHDAVISSSEQEGASHGLLIAVLMKLGGSIDLDIQDFASEAMGDEAGRFYGIDMQPITETSLRLSVVNQHGRT